MFFLAAFVAVMCPPIPRTCGRDLFACFLSTHHKHFAIMVPPQCSNPTQSRESFHDLPNLENIVGVEMSQLAKQIRD